jgi:predicted nucleic acid-binding protein
VRLALDTNRYTDFWAGDAQVVEHVERAEEVLLPFVVIAELRYGFLKGSRRDENEAVLRKFLNKRGVSILLSDEATIFQFAAIQHQLRRGGTPIPAHDVWIAALTLQHGLTLYARDKHFDHLPQLMRL